MSKPTSVGKTHLRSIVAADNPSLRDKLIGAGAACVVGGIIVAAMQAYKHYAPRKAHYKLTYFNSRGIAEPIRFMFALAGVEYEDYRFPAEPVEILGGVARPAAFIQTKENYPFAQVPVLEVNGKVMAQSRAIERYLAKQFGFFGHNDYEAQLIDSVVEHLHDLTLAFRQAEEKDKATNSKTEEDRFFGGTLATGLRYLNRFAVAHGTASNHSTLVGSSLSLADICLFYFLSSFSNQTTVVQICSAYPNLRVVRESVSNLPQIRNWILKRPESVK